MTLIVLTGPLNSKQKRTPSEGLDDRNAAYQSSLYSLWIIAKPSPGEDEGSSYLSVYWLHMSWGTFFSNEPAHVKTYKLVCAPSEGSDQHGHPPSLILVFAVRMKKALVLTYPLSAQWRLWSDWANGQADLSLRWAPYHFVGFNVRWIKLLRKISKSSTFFQHLSNCAVWNPKVLS